MSEQGINELTKNFEKCKISSSKINIMSSEFQTKTWVHNNISTIQKDSKREKWQRNKTEKITNKDCIYNRGLRINEETLIMEKRICYMTRDGECIPDGLEWTEDFDGEQSYGSTRWLYNFKFTTEGGGSQTHKDRCLNSFIRAQLNYIKSNNKQDTYFINILDGDHNYHKMPCYTHLKNKYSTNISKYVFIGDTKQFQDWFISFNK